MKGFQKFYDLAVAVGKLNMHDLSHVHVTTNDFFFLKPAMSLEVPAKTNIFVDMNTFTRATPMSRPAYVDVDIVQHAFFVPYRTCWPMWQNFYDGTPCGNYQPTIVPQFLTDNFFKFVLEDGNGNLKVSGQQYTFFKEFTPSSSESFSTKDLRFTLNGTNHFCHMTRLGKQFVAVLQGLGYNFPLDCGAAAAGNVDEQQNFIHSYTGLPLLSFLRIWFDYFMPSNKDCSVRIERTNMSYDEVMNPRNIFRENTFTVYDKISIPYLAAIAFWLTMIPYEKDYFQLISPEPVLSEVENADMPQSGYVVDSTTVRDGLNSQVNLGNSIPQGQTTTGSGITNWLLEAVSEVTKFFQRDNYAGVRDIDRYLARFGITLSSEQLQRSIYLGKQEQKLDVSAQMNTSPSSGSVLGDYAGKADSYPMSTGHFKFNSTEFGQFIIISQFIPKSYTYQNLRREMLHLRRNEYFQPEFDALGYQGVSRAEFANVGINNSALAYADPSQFRADLLYGWVPRYAEYKQGTDKSLLTGDFRIYTAGADSYRTMQLFRERSSPFTFVRREHCIGSWDGTLDRIFVNQDSFYDHFITYYSFDVKAYSPARPLFEVLDNIDGEHHETVKREVGGTQL